MILVVRAHYNAALKSIEVGSNTLPLALDAFNGQGQGGTIIDSGTTLAYLPDEIYTPLINQVRFTLLSIITSRIINI